MLKSGTIANIEANGGYQSQNGYISTFMLTLRNEEGQITGEIGSKSQQYPMAIGEPITVDIRTDQYGTKFKKVNPQYQQNAPQGGSQMPQNQPQGQNAPQSGRNTSIERQCAWKAACNRAQGSSLTHDDVACLAEMGIYFIENGQRKPQQRQTNNTQQDDNIPF